MNLPKMAVAATILLSIVFFSARCGPASAAEEPRIEARFVAQVEWIEQIGRREAKVVPIGVDMRWLVGIKIQSIQQATPGFDKKGEVILAVHSPSRLLSQPYENATGKTFAFEVTGRMMNGRPDYSYAAGRELP